MSRAISVALCTPPGAPRPSRAAPRAPPFSPGRFSHGVFPLRGLVDVDRRDPNFRPRGPPLDCQLCAPRPSSCLSVDTSRRYATARFGSVFGASSSGASQSSCQGPSVVTLPDPILRQNPLRTKVGPRSDPGGGPDDSDPTPAGRAVRRRALPRRAPGPVARGVSACQLGAETTGRSIDDTVPTIDCHRGTSGRWPIVGRVHSVESPVSPEGGECCAHWTEWTRSVD